MSEHVVGLCAVTAVVVAYTRSVQVAACIGIGGVVAELVANRVALRHRGAESPGVPRGGLWCGVLLLLAFWAQMQWERSEPHTLGPYVGWVEVVDEPQSYRGATRAILEVDGQRYEYWTRGRAGRLRVERWSGGDTVRLGGERTALAPDRRERVAWQHVVGAIEVDWIGDEQPATGLAGASNRVRGLIEEGASSLPGDDGALFRGLVIGDDTDEPWSMIDRFRSAGLSHLTAVSGQNVVFVLAAASPLLRRMGPWPRWLLTLGLIGWFVALTRFEPSILRAGMMATVSATGFVMGRERSPLRILSVSVIALVWLDPMIARSIGFILSAGATFGVVAIAPFLTRRLRLLGWMAEPIGVTLGAQLGVAVPALVVFGRVPLVSLPANLMAVPAAGFVMLYGLPAGLIAGAVPPLAPVVMFPCRVGVRWVDAVAVVASAAEPSGGWVLTGWIAIALACLAMWGGLRWRGVESPDAFELPDG